uniref:Uncharacterized protein n=1 Tax=Anguilla anguilla TaxID=7936 RepID=A0A0E9VJW4_ANGAN
MRTCKGTVSQNQQHSQHSHHYPSHCSSRLSCRG